MKKNYIFYDTCFEKELLRKQMIALNDNGIDYKVIDKNSNSSFRAPLSGYFEAEIHVSEIDFEKADRLLNALNE